MTNKQGTLIPDIRSMALSKCPAGSRNEDQTQKIKFFDPKYRLHSFQSRLQM